MEDFRNLRLQAEQYEKIVLVLSSLRRKLNAQAVLLISRSGQEIAVDGDVEFIDRQALASLAASNLAATFGLAKLIGEAEFERIYHRGKGNSILINPAGDLALMLFLLGNNGGSSIDLKSLKQATMVVGHMLEMGQQE